MKRCFLIFTLCSIILTLVVVSLGGAMALASAAVPNELLLKQNTPNPFNPHTIISFRLPQTSEVAISIYDLAGRLVQGFALGYQDAGSHEFLWDASFLASGVYFYRLEACDNNLVRKALLLK